MLIILITIVLILWYMLNNCKRPLNYPPGPLWLPFLGNTLLIERMKNKHGGIHKVFEALSQSYKTDILSLRLGSEHFVIVSSFPLIKEILSREEFQGKPNDFFNELRSMGTLKGITMTDGEFSRIQRKFVKEHLRQLGFGKDLMQELIQTELDDLLNVFGESLDKEIEFDKILSLSVLNVLWVIIAGTRLERSDERLTKLFIILKKRVELFDVSGGILNQFPWLRLVAPEKVGFNLIQKLNKNMKELIMDTINDHKKTMKKGKNSDLIYAFLSEMEGDTSENNMFSEDQLMMICVDLFIAGSFSQSNTLNLAFLMMIMYPEVQKKLQTVIDNEFKPSEQIKYRDRNRVPYVEAVLNEVVRYCHIAPIGGPRRVTCDTQLNGYTIPKDTTVLYSIHSSHSCKEYWVDPDVFRPERFLGDNGKLIIHDAFIPFSMGSRRCLGQVLARSCIFTIFCGIIRKYNIAAYPGTHPTGKIGGGWFSIPEKYNAKVTSRFDLKQTIENGNCNL